MNDVINHRFLLIEGARLGRAEWAVKALIASRDIDTLHSIDTLVGGLADALGETLVDINAFV